MAVVCLDYTTLGTLPLFHCAVGAYGAEVVGVEAEFNGVYCVAMAF